MSIQSNWQRKMRQQGRCIICACPHDTGAARCPSCLVKARGFHRKRRAAWRAEGRCIGCGAGMLGPSQFVRCLDCRVAAAKKAKRAYRAMKASAVTPLMALVRS